MQSRSHRMHAHAGPASGPRSTRPTARASRPHQQVCNQAAELDPHLVVGDAGQSLKDNGGLTKLSRKRADRPRRKTARPDPALSMSACPSNPSIEPRYNCGPPSPICAAACSGLPPRSWIMAALTSLAQFHRWQELARAASPFGFSFLAVETGSPLRKVFARPLASPAALALEKRYTERKKKKRREKQEGGEYKKINRKEEKKESQKPFPRKRRRAGRRRPPTPRVGLVFLTGMKSDLFSTGS